MKEPEEAGERCLMSPDAMDKVTDLTRRMEAIDRDSESMGALLGEFTDMAFATRLIGPLPDHVSRGSRLAQNLDRLDEADIEEVRCGLTFLVRQLHYKLDGLDPDEVLPMLRRLVVLASEDSGQ